MQIANGLKLFVVGQSSWNPETWNPFGGNTGLVLAHNEHEAISMVDFTDVAAEIVADKPILLAVLPFRCLE